MDPGIREDGDDKNHPQKLIKLRLGHKTLLANSLERLDYKQFLELTGLTETPSNESFLRNLYQQLIAQYYHNCEAEFEKIYEELNLKQKFLEIETLQQQQQRAEKLKQFLDKLQADGEKDPRLKLKLLELEQLQKMIAQLRETDTESQLQRQKALSQERFEVAYSLLKSCQEADIRSQRWDESDAKDWTLQQQTQPYIRAAKKRRMQQQISTSLSLQQHLPPPFSVSNAQEDSNKLYT